MITDGQLVGAGLAVLVAALLAVQAISIRLGTRRRDGPAHDALVTVFVVNILTFSTVVILQDYETYRMTFPSIGAFIGAGLMGTLIGGGLYFTGIERIGASRADAIKASQPMTATIIAILVLAERVTALNVVGIVLIVGGVIFLISEQSDQPLVGGDVGAGVLYPFGAAVFLGMEPTFAKIGLGIGTPVFVGLLVKTITAMVGLLVFLRWQGLLTIGNLKLSMQSKWYLITALANTASLVAYYYALTIAPVAIVLPIAQASPLLVIGFSYFYLPRLEEVTPRVVSGGICIVSGAVMVVLFG